MPVTDWHFFVIENPGQPGGSKAISLESVIKTPFDLLNTLCSGNNKIKPQIKSGSNGDEKASRTSDRSLNITYFLLWVIGGPLKGYVNFCVSSLMT